MLASHMNHGDINTMAQSNQTPNRNSKMSSYLNQTDSDDDDNQPPALSDYALALLQKDKESQIPKQTADQGPQQHQNRHLPKRVNFHYDTKRKNENFIAINNNNNTAHTNQSEYETIFTKNVHGDLNSIASSSPNEKNSKDSFKQICIFT